MEGELEELKGGYFDINSAHCCSINILKLNWFLFFNDLRVAVIFNLCDYRFMCKQASFFMWTFNGQLDIESFSINFFFYLFELK